MTMQTKLWLMFGVRFGPLFGTDDSEIVSGLLEEAMDELTPQDTVIIGSAYGYDTVVLDFLARLAAPPKIRVVSPYKGATTTWPPEAARKFLGQVEDTQAEEFWLAERHQDGVYSQRDAFVLAEAKLAFAGGDAVRALVLWPGNPGVLADTIRGAVVIGATTTNLWPCLRERI